MDKKQWLIREMRGSMTDGKTDYDPNKYYYWEISEVGRRSITNAGSYYEELKLLMNHFEISHPSGLAGRFFETPDTFCNGCTALEYFMEFLLEEEKAPLMSQKWLFG